MSRFFFTFGFWAYIIIVFLFDISFVWLVPWVKKEGIVDLKIIVDE